jgi:hypothetical protein
MDHMHIQVPRMQRPFHEGDIDLLFDEHHRKQILKNGLVLFNPGLGRDEFLLELLERALLPDIEPALDAEEKHVKYNGCLHRTILMGSDLHTLWRDPQIKQSTKAIRKPSLF